MRCGFVAVIGATNAGKSTLVNTIVGSKVAIVSPKAQTTRMNVRGVALHGDAQIILVDTPGIFLPRRRLDRAMVNAAWVGADQADAIVLLVDAAEMTSHPTGAVARQTDAIFGRLATSSRPVALILNKIDVMKRERLLPLVHDFNERGALDATFMISALRADGIDEVIDWCASKMPEGPWLYPAEQTADIPLRLLAAELTREQLYRRLRDELPYSSTVQTESWKERSDGSVAVEQTIFVQRDSQRAIVLGKEGTMIKDIGAASRKELEQVVNRKIHLRLFVKVNEDWQEVRSFYEETGLDFPGD